MTKRIKILVLFLISFCYVLGQNKGVTFQVCDLPSVDHQFKNVNYSDALQKRCGKGIEAWSKNDSELIESSFHPFVEAVHDAYAYHRPLVISPDMVWLMIIQGFARHVNENSDSLRHYFVDFNGKKVLKVNRDEFIKGSPNNNWENVFPDFTRQIGEYTGQELLNTSLLQFSTTGSTEKAAFEITLMDAMSSYFIYAVYTSCGITQITLEGTISDWEMILEKTKKLEKYDLKWWTDELIPVLEQFVEASKGKVDKNFWEEIYKRTSVGSGSPKISGWIIKFFPYLSENKKYVRNNHFDSYITTKDFTSGLSKADFYWIYYGVPYQMEFYAGFLGIKEDSSSHTLRPQIGWAIRDKGEKGIKEEDEQYKDDIMK